MNVVKAGSPLTKLFGSAHEDKQTDDHTKKSDKNIWL